MRGRSRCWRCWQLVLTRGPGSAGSAQAPDSAPSQSTAPRAVPDLRRAVQDAHRGEPLARLRRARRRHGAAAARVPEVPHPVVDRQERRGPRHQGDDDPQPRHRRRGDQGRDVHRGQRPRQRDPGRRGLPLHDLVPDGALRSAAAHQAAGRRARVLRRADGEPRRPRALSCRCTRAGAPATSRSTTTTTASPTRTTSTTSTATASSSRCGATCRGRARTASAASIRGCSSRRRPGTKGDYVILGFEGLDNDGDGQVNEDGPGGYDMNRNWPADWQPSYVQNGVDGLSVPAARGARGRRLPAVQAQRRRRAVVPQLRRHDPARARRRGAGRVSRCRTCASTTSSAGPASGCCRTTATW